MAAFVSRPSSLPSAPPSRADGLREGERVSDPPDDERARDDVFLVAREHLGLAGLVHAPPHVEQGRLIDGPGQLPVQARLAWPRAADVRSG